MRRTVIGGVLVVVLVAMAAGLFWKHKHDAEEYGAAVQCVGLDLQEIDRVLLDEGRDAERPGIVPARAAFAAAVARRDALDGNEWAERGRIVLEQMLPAACAELATAPNAPCARMAWCRGRPSRDWILGVHPRSRLMPPALPPRVAAPVAPRTVSSNGAIPTAAAGSRWCKSPRGQLVELPVTRPCAAEGYTDAVDTTPPRWTRPERIQCRDQDGQIIDLSGDRPCEAHGYEDAAQPARRHHRRH